MLHETTILGEDARSQKDYNKKYQDLRDHYEGMGFTEDEIEEAIQEEMEEYEVPRKEFKCTFNMKDVKRHFEGTADYNGKEIPVTGIQFNNGEIILSLDNYEEFTRKREKFAGATTKDLDI